MLSPVRRALVRTERNSRLAIPLALLAPPLGTAAATSALRAAKQPKMATLF